MEDRRRRAVQRVNNGESQAGVAKSLGVSPITVNRWVRQYRIANNAGLAGKPHPGRKPFLTPEQEAAVLGWLADKPTEHGFRNDVWTVRRVAQLMKTRFGVEYHPGYLRAWLIKRGYSKGLVNAGQIDVGPGAP
jgi:transposase